MVLTNIYIKLYNGVDGKYNVCIDKESKKYQRWEE